MLRCTKGNWAVLLWQLTEWIARSKIYYTGLFSFKINLSANSYIETWQTVSTSFWSLLLTKNKKLLSLLFKKYHEGCININFWFLKSLTLKGPCCTTEIYCKSKYSNLKELLDTVDLGISGNFWSGYFNRISFLLRKIKIFAFCIAFGRGILIWIIIKMHPTQNFKKPSICHLIHIIFYLQALDVVLRAGFK